MGAEVSVVQDVSVKCRAECRGERACAGHGGPELCEGHGAPEQLEDTFSNQKGGKRDTLPLLNHKLLKAAQDGDLDTLKLALRKGACIETRRPFVMSPEAMTMKELTVTSRGTGMTPLMYAAQGGYAQACEALLAQGACANAEDEDGTKPLHFAAGAGSLETCQVLLQGGAEVTARDDEGHGALEHVPAHEMATPAERKLWTSMLEPMPPHADACEFKVETCEFKVENAGMEDVQHPPCTEAMEPEISDAGPEN